MDRVASPRPASTPGLTIAFRPVVDLVGARPFAYEAMLRGPKGESGEEIFEILPADRHAELDRRVAGAAVHHAMAAGLGSTSARLMIPIHVGDVNEPAATLETAVHAAKKCGLAPERIVFAIHGYTNVSGARLADLVGSHRRAGCLTAFVGLDHDPVGFTPCVRYRPAMVRLDSDLVDGIDGSWSRRLVLEELTPRLAKLGIRIIADGVSRPPVLQRLRSFGIFYAQGELVAAPQVGALPEHRIERAAAA